MWPENNLHLRSLSGEINKIENLSHTVQLDLVPGNLITMDGQTFEYRQMHFHTPSEHMIDGITYPMEMHVVATMQDQPEGETTEYLVPKDEGGVAKINLNALEHNNIGTAENFLQEIHTSYHYSGSLTTPPYTESVRWYVLKRIFEASPVQIHRINKLEGDNARHIQANYERSISD